jgi:hypothetical protein
MGGRALKNTFTRRYSRDEFEAAKIELLPRFEKHFEQVTIPRFFANKETFGDIDVLCQVRGNEDIREIIKNEFGPNEIFHNGNCYSFDYNELQVDLITTSAEHFHSNFMYLSFNDLGNMIGRLAHPFGLKYGQEGLWFKYFDHKNHMIGQVTISKDYPAIFKFFGLDFTKWEEGFNDLEDIFRFVASSPYFDWRQYQMDTLNHINRERNLKRASYMTLLEWIETNNIRKEYDFLVNKNDYIDMIDAAFPEANLPTEVRKLEYRNAEKLYIQAKFNGNKITRKFGLIGADLGNAIAGYKQYLKNNHIVDFDKFILNTDEYIIWSSFGHFIENENSSKIFT